VGLLSSQEQNNIEENSKKSRSPFFEKYHQKKITKKITSKSRNQKKESKNNYEKNHVKNQKIKKRNKKITKTIKKNKTSLTKLKIHNTQFSKYFYPSNNIIIYFLMINLSIKALKY